MNLAGHTPKPSGKQGVKKFDIDELDFTPNTTLTFKLPDSLKREFISLCNETSNTISSELKRYMTEAVHVQNLSAMDVPIREGELVPFTFRVSSDLKQQFSLLCKKKHVSVSHALRKYMTNCLSFFGRH